MRMKERRCLANGSLPRCPVIPIKSYTHTVPEFPAESLLQCRIGLSNIREFPENPREIRIPGHPFSFFNLDLNIDIYKPGHPSSLKFFLALILFDVHPLPGQNGFPVILLKNL
jgi:hypothetical protein